MLEDVERIEVISGPGGTLWGANAVNGVINVITRPAGRHRWARSPTRAAATSNAARRARYGGALGGDGALPRLREVLPSRQQPSCPTARRCATTSDRAQVGFRADSARPATARSPCRATRTGADLDQAPVGTSHRRGQPPRAADARSSTTAARCGCRRTTTTRTATTSSSSRRTSIRSTSRRSTAGSCSSATSCWWAPATATRATASRNTAAQAFLPADEDAELEQRVRAGRDRARRGADAHPWREGRAQRLHAAPSSCPSARLAWRVRPTFFSWAAVVARGARPVAHRPRLLLARRPPFLLVGNDTFTSEVANVYEAGHPRASRPRRSRIQRHAVRRAVRPAAQRPSRSGRPSRSSSPTASKAASAASRRGAPGAWRRAGGSSAASRRCASTLELKAGQHRRVTAARRSATTRASWWSLRSYFDITPQHEVDVTVRHANARTRSLVPRAGLHRGRPALAWRPSRARRSLADRRRTCSTRATPNGTNRAEIGRSVFLKVTWTP